MVKYLRVCYNDIYNQGMVLEWNVRKMIISSEKQNTSFEQLSNELVNHPQFENVYKRYVESSRHYNISVVDGAVVLTANYGRSTINNDDMHRIFLYEYEENGQNKTCLVVTSVKLTFDHGKAQLIWQGQWQEKDVETEFLTELYDEQGLIGEKKISFVANKMIVAADDNKKYQVYDPFDVRRGSVPNDHVSTNFPQFINLCEYIPSVSDVINGRADIFWKTNPTTVCRNREYSVQATRIVDDLKTTENEKYTSSGQGLLRTSETVYIDNKTGNIIYRRKISVNLNTNCFTITTEGDAMAYGVPKAAQKVA